MYVFTDNYNVEFAQYIDELFADDKTLKLSRLFRLHASDSLTEAYMSHTGERPPSAQLGRLATLILRDELADPHPDKMTREEYPLLSPTQREEREADEVPTDFSEDDDDTNANHSRLNIYLATDGKSYRLPIRRTREIGELIRKDYAESRRKNENLT